MSSDIEFETPENVRLNYEPAGLGSRFLAFLTDRILLTLVMAFAGFLLFLLWVGDTRIQAWFTNLTPDETRSRFETNMYYWGLFALIMGLGSFFYFAFFEYIMNGQTPGKRSTGIRVVKTDGFALDASSILLRSLFRVIDDTPILWIVPMISKNSQRLGDLAAGTIVVKDQPMVLSEVRTNLVHAISDERRFRFDAAVLKRARPSDFQAIERIMERWDDLPTHQQERLLETMCEPLARRLEMDIPPAEHRLRFLQELLAAEYRRQQRKLG
jgi:uncharacterized RDD family membrane protein YckC